MASLGIDNNGNHITMREQVALFFLFCGDLPQSTEVGACTAVVPTEKRSRSGAGSMVERKGFMGSSSVYIIILEWNDSSTS